MSNTGPERLANASTDANGVSYICAKCDRHFLTNGGLNQQLRACYLKNKISDVQTLYKTKKDEANDQKTDDSNIEIPEISTSLLQYKWDNYQDYLSERNRLQKNDLLEGKSIFITIWTTKGFIAEISNYERVDTRVAIKRCRT